MKRALLTLVTVGVLACAYPLVTSEFVSFTPVAHAETVWVGHTVSPGELKKAFRITSNVQTLTNNPPAVEIGQCLTQLLGDADTGTPPLESVCTFEQTAGIPDNICGDDDACSAFGKTVCEYGNSIYARKGAEVVADYCMVFCSRKPARTNPALFWFGVECPEE